MSNKKGVKKILAGVIGLAIIGAIAYGANLGNNQAANSNSADAKDGLFPIKTWSRTDCTATPWIIADKKGFFAEEGLKIVYTGDTQAPQQIPSILNGNNDVGGGFHPNNIAVAVAGGAKIKAVGRMGIDPKPDQDPKLRHMFWYANPKSGIKSFADLKDRPNKAKFSTITTNICADFLANQIADKNGVPRNKLEWVSMPDVQAVQALKQGLVEVAGVHPPYYKSMDDAGMIKIADTFDAGLGELAGVSYTVFNEEFIKQHPDIIEKFNRAMAKAQKWANEHPEEARKLTEDWIGVPVNATHYYSTDPTIDESQMIPWINDLENSGVLPKGKVKPADLVYHP